MIRRPPRSTLFPTRRSSDLGQSLDAAALFLQCRCRACPAQSPATAAPAAARSARSEEHTSELQSQSNLVCRLLLEKKTTDTRHGGPIVTPHVHDQSFRRYYL